MNILPVLARAFGVDPVAFERQVEAYENPDEWALAAEAEVRKLKQEHVEQAAKRDALEAECRRLRKLGQALRESCKYCERMGVHSGKECAEWDRHVASLTPPEAQGREEETK